MPGASEPFAAGRLNAARAYLAGLALDARYIELLPGFKLRLAGWSEGDKALIRELKPELLELLEQSEPSSHSEPIPLACPSGRRGDHPAVLGPAPFDPVLEALCSAVTPEDAQALREERAGILEHDGGMDRAEAERMAGVSSLACSMAA